MVDKLKRTQGVGATSIHPFNPSAKPTQAKSPPLDRTLLTAIISELSTEKSTVSAATVQHKIIVKTLISHFGFAASTEPKFKKMYNYINEQMTANKQAQALITDAINRYVQGDN